MSKSRRGFITVALNDHVRRDEIRKRIGIVSRALGLSITDTYLLAWEIGLETLEKDLDKAGILESQKKLLQRQNIGEKK